MTDVTPAKPARRLHHWRRDLVELAALFTAVAVADSIAKLIVHGPDGPVLLVASAVALAATAAFHSWWSHRHGHSPPGAAAAGAPAGAGSGAATGPGEGSEGGDGTAVQAATLWRVRTTVRDTPGSLAALCTALARRGVDILALQTHPLSEGTVDEFLLRAPAELAPADLGRVISGAGGRDIWTERADAHDLVDTPTRVLNLATRTALDSAELPLALRELLGRCTIRSQPRQALAGSPQSGGAEGEVPPEGVLEGTVMRLRDPSGGTIGIERPYLAFTPTEFARARALVGLDARLGPRMPRGRDVWTLPGGSEITVRRADTTDIPAARDMHERCSPETLRKRYHGPVKDADRYLAHLLSPRFGRTLAVQTASGRLVALGHLMWDGDETEVALLVEDAWQRRGIGGELLRRLVALAGEAGCESVYAVTQSGNTGMVAAMRGLGLPLDYQIEEGTLVITARLARTGRTPARPQAPDSRPPHGPYTPATH
ncbi:GNAT family N-acetyltransferase [Streptomyces sp. S07_1.15]|uniref:GNAT family N-acetyltransferase n=1 Tax=Streptomyces sp. S07_1.15 TaxID=2873925 RepID=UPI001D152572|nr:GNAT family N-acetyltransferase [Streptomyces sp. S07_1.15]MCC3650078.1 GNAT family N-acetyltransferase [Streptomyces sp. S07_1.15]